MWDGILGYELDNDLKKGLGPTWMPKDSGDLHYQRLGCTWSGVQVRLVPVISRVRKCWHSGP